MYALHRRGHGQKGGRFVSDLEAWIQNEKFLMQDTLLDPRTGKSEPGDGEELANALLDPLIKFERPAPRFSPPERYSAQGLADSQSFSTIGISRWLQDSSELARPRSSKTEIRGIERRLARMLSPYFEDGISSVDLVGAMRRQTKLIDEMAKLGWTAPGRLGGGSDDAALARAMVRYHSFLDLLGVEHSLLCPTLDVDLC